MKLSILKEKIWMMFKMDVEKIIENFDDCVTKKSKFSNRTICKKRNIIKQIVHYGRKGQIGNMTMIIVFVFLLGVIGTGIYFGTWMFFSSDYDFREIDAKILNKNIRLCIKNQEINWSNSDKEALSSEFLKKCRINSNVTDNLFFIQIKNGDVEILNLGRGDGVQCGLLEKNTKYMRCFNSTIHESYGNEEFLFFIQTGSNQNYREKIT